MSGKQVRKKPADTTAKFVSIDTFPKVGGGIPVSEGRRDFHPRVSQLCSGGFHDATSLGEKLIVVGGHNIGKTCLIRRYVEDQFTDGYKATIGVDFMYQRYKILGVDFTVHIWDTAGQEQFKCVSRAYFRGASAVILAFDLGNVKSLEDVHDWLAEVRRENTSPFLTFLVGLKSDTYHAVDNEMGQRVAAQLNAEYWECSSKHNENISALFSRIAVGLFEGAIIRQLRESENFENNKPQIVNTIEISDNSNNYISITDSNSTSANNKSCC